MIHSIPKTFVIETERLILRIPKVYDIPHVFSATRHPGFNDDMLWKAPMQEEELYRPLRENIEAWEKADGYTFSLVDQESTTFLGRISIRRSEKRDSWNIGFWTHPKVQNRGFMTEALAAILEFGFERLSAVIIEANYTVWNKASERVLVKNGFQLIDRIEEGFKKNGSWNSVYLMRITQSSWKSGRLD